MWLSKHKLTLLLLGGMVMPALLAAMAVPGKPGELRNGDFAIVDHDGFPAGWSAYGSIKPDAYVKDGLLLITDSDDEGEAGLFQDVTPVKPGKHEAVVEAKLQHASSDSGGAFLQLRLAAGNRSFRSTQTVTKPLDHLTPASKSRREPRPSGSTSTPTKRHSCCCRQKSS